MRYADKAFVLVYFVTFIGYTSLKFQRDYMLMMILTSATWLFKILWISVYALSFQDGRVFAIKVFQRMFFTYTVLRIILSVALYRRVPDLFLSLANSSGMCISFLILWILIFVVSVAQIHRIARVPLYGRCLAEFFTADPCS